jgi:hypothetical protein
MFINMIIGDITQYVADRKLPGANILSVGAIIAHMAAAEDVMVHAIVRGQATVLSGGGHAAATGITPGGRPELNAAFGAKSYPGGRAPRLCERRLPGHRGLPAGATDADLGEEVSRPMGKSPSSQFLGGLAMGHPVAHAGEVAAVKGVFGLKGLLF